MAERSTRMDESNNEFIKDLIWNKMVKGKLYH